MLNVEIISWADRRRAAGIATPQIRPIRILSPEPPRRHRLAPVLATADEADLVRRYLRGDRMSGDRLLRAHDNMIRSKACRLARRCSLLEESDLVQAGRIGFLDALRTFDPDGNGTLAAYAGTAAFHAMLNLIDEQDDAIKIGSHQRQAIRRALKSGGLSAKLAAIDGLRRLASLDQPADDDDERTLLDRLSYGGTPEDALIAWEEIRSREPEPAWRGSAVSAADDREHIECIRTVSRGRAALRDRLTP